MDLHGHTQEISIGLCLVLGALHALEPGHGKTAFIAHLLTEQRNVFRPLVLALTTATTHALSIVLIAVVVHGLVYPSISPTGGLDIQPYLHLMSGAVLSGLGLAMLSRRRQAQPAALLPGVESPGAGCSCQAHTHHAHRMSDRGWKTLATGFAVGLVPCPSALVALTTALVSGELAAALWIVAMFSLGIFVALTLVGAGTARFSRILHRLAFARMHPQCARYVQVVVFVAAGLWHMTLYWA